jgi:hypothetical protein
MSTATAERCHGRDVDPEEFGYHHCRRPVGHEGAHACYCGHVWRYEEVPA